MIIRRRRRRRRRRRVNLWDRQNGTVGKLSTRNRGRDRKKTT